MPLSIKDISVNTLLGAGSKISGDVSVSGFARVDGDIDGSLNATGKVIIGENSRIRGDVQGLIVTVGGIVEGDVVAPEGVHILSTGAVIGDIITKRLSAAESVLLHGYCFAVDDQARFEEACFARSNRKAAAAQRDLGLAKAET